MMKSSTLDVQSRPRFPSLDTLGGEHSFPAIDPETTRLPLLVVFKSQLVNDADIHTDEADVERLRAEVRGLGMTLLVVAPDGVRRFESNDRYRCMKSPDDLATRQLMSLFRTFAVVPPGSPSSRGLIAAFVLGPQFEIRFAFRTPTDGSGDAPPQDGCGALLPALVAASRSFEMIRLPHVPLVELTTRALVMGLEQALAPVSGHDGLTEAARAAQEARVRQDAGTLFGTPSRWAAPLASSGARRKTDPAILRRRSPPVTGPRLDAEG